MNLKINSINNAGNHLEEFIWLEVLGDTNLSSYLLTDSTYTNGTPSNKWRHPYRFPNRSAKKGDWVQLRTRKGKDDVGKRTSTNGKHEFTVHELHWNLDTPVWNNTGDVAHLFALVDHQAVKKA